MNNPKETADDIYLRFKNILDQFGADDGFTHSKVLSCCNMYVNGIIRSNPHSNPFNTDQHSTLKYLIEVKKEISKL